MHGGNRAGGRRERARVLAAFAGAAAGDPEQTTAAVQRAVQELQRGDVVDDRAMLALQIVRVASAQDDRTGDRRPKVPVR